MLGSDEISDNGGRATMPRQDDSDSDDDAVLARVDNGTGQTGGQTDMDAEITSGQSAAELLETQGEQGSSADQGTKRARDGDDDQAARPARWAASERPTQSCSARPSNPPISPHAGSRSRRDVAPAATVVPRRAMRLHQ